MWVKDIDANQEYLFLKRFLHIHNYMFFNVTSTYKLATISISETLNKQEANKMFNGPLVFKISQKSDRIL